MTILDDARDKRGTQMAREARAQEHLNRQGGPCGTRDTSCTLTRRRTSCSTHPDATRSRTHPTICWVGEAPIISLDTDGHDEAMKTRRPIPPVVDAA